jgi:hypothetical protein
VATFCRWLVEITSRHVPLVTQPTPDALRVAIRETRTLTDKPFGVNITILPSIVPPDYAGYARAAVEEGSYHIFVSLKHCDL